MNQTQAQKLLKIHLAELGIETVAEFKFSPDRRFRFDLFCERLRMGFEVNGTFKGLHGPRFGNSDNEKLNLAVLHGYRVLVFTNREVERGDAKRLVQEWLADEKK